MGCDIHWYSETKKEGTWLCDQADSFDTDPDDFGMDSFPGSRRDYYLFGLLQPGVRTEWEWSFPERPGLPDGVSTEIKALSDHLDCDGHSHGYVTRAEIKTKLEELKVLQTSHLISPQKGTLASTHHVGRLKEILANLNADVPDTDQRVVFWFDN